MHISLAFPHSFFSPIFFISILFLFIFLFLSFIPFLPSLTDCCPYLLSLFHFLLLFLFNSSHSLLSLPLFFSSFYFIFNPPSSILPSFSLHCHPSLTFLPPFLPPSLLPSQVWSPLLSLQSYTIPWFACHSH